MIDNETKKRLDAILNERNDNILSAPSIVGRYKEKLLTNFPAGECREDYFIRNTFTGIDDEDYVIARIIFDNKKWNEVSFDILKCNLISFQCLSNDGVLYYLPAFLNNLYDLMYIDSELFLYFLSDLEEGLHDVTSEFIEMRGKEKGFQIPPNYKAFEQLNIEQSKLVALFLVNVANLLPEDWHAAKQAQRALTNYWGTFLLF